MEVTIKDLFIIVGPVMSFRSNDNSFVNVEEDLIAPYDENNCYNVWNNQLSIKNRPLKS